MDFQQVGDLDKYAVLMKQVQENVARAASRKGEQPSDHPPTWLLLQSFMSQLEANNAQLSRSQKVIATSQVPAPYAPCTLPAADLKPMTISQMKLETHHRGHQIVVRVLTPPDRMTAVMAIVEDEEGTAVLLQLYHQPAETVVPKVNILQQGGYVLIKEPFFKTAATNGSYNIRADHVSDVIFLDDTNDLVPKKWRKRVETIATGLSSREIRLQGNKAVEKMEWAMAERL